MIYLTKHLTEAAYEAAASNLAKPHVALTTDDNKVHYMPTTPPTPSLSVVSVNGGSELPICTGGVYIQINRPIRYEELLGLKIVVSQSDDCESSDEYVLNAEYNGDTIYWINNDTDVELYCNPFEEETDGVELHQGDYYVKYFRFYFE